MPLACFKEIREVSSEDIGHPAESLLKQQSGKKWKTKESGEKSAYVIIEFKEPYQITGIDIGNEHSAFVEALVGTVGCARENFTEILMTSSFMTPNESKSSTNINRVRCFSQEVLVQTAVAKKWQMLKIVCSQPFNKYVKYGLSFINVHVVENKGPHSPKASPGAIGKFRLREDSPELEPLSTSALFDRWKTSRGALNDNKQLTTAASIREASSPAALNKQHQQKRNFKELGILGDKERSHTDDIKHSFINNGKDHEKKTSNRPSVASSTQKKADLIDIEKKSPNVQKAQRKRSVSPKTQPPKKVKADSHTEYRPFNQLLRGVVLVISGIQNPDRTDIRNKLLAMGGKYRADWEPGCTHLICAFKNTPKYNQVQGKGKIVYRNWIEKCYALKKYLPWRRYAIDKSEAGEPESDNEICDESLRVKIVDSDDDELDILQPESSAANGSKPVSPNIDGRHSNSISQCCSSGSDTEDEIERVTHENNQKKLNPTNTPKIEKDIYEGSTEDEDYLADLRKLKKK